MKSTLTSRYLTESEIKAMAEAVLSTLEVTPLSHARKCEVAREHSVDEFGVRPSKGAVLLAVKMANLGWWSLGVSTNAILREAA